MGMYQDFIYICHLPNTYCLEREQVHKRVKHRVIINNSGVVSNTATDLTEYVGAVERRGMLELFQMFYISYWRKRSW
jgi:hypothetical protein